MDMFVHRMECEMVKYRPVHRDLLRVDLVAARAFNLPASQHAPQNENASPATLKKNSKSSVAGCRSVTFSSSALIQSWRTYGRREGARGGSQAIERTTIVMMAATQEARYLPLFAISLRSVFLPQNTHFCADRFAMAALALRSLRASNAFCRAYSTTPIVRGRKPPAKPKAELNAALRGAANGGALQRRPSILEDTEQQRIDKRMSESEKVDVKWNQHSGIELFDASEGELGADIDGFLPDAFEDDDTSTPGHMLIQAEREALHYFRIIEHEIPKLTGPSLQSSHTCRVLKSQQRIAKSSCPRRRRPQWSYGLSGIARTTRRL